MVSRAIASIAALLLRHLAPEMYSAAGYTLPNYHPYQVARHLAAEISAEAALRVVALPHTEGPLNYLLALTVLSRLTNTMFTMLTMITMITMITVITVITSCLLCLLCSQGSLCLRGLPRLLRSLSSLSSLCRTPEGCGVSDERLAARTLLGHLASPLVRPGYPPACACACCMCMCTLFGHLASPLVGHTLLLEHS